MLFIITSSGQPAPSLSLSPFLSTRVLLTGWCGVASGLRKQLEQLTQRKLVYVCVCVCVCVCARMHMQMPVHVCVCVRIRMCMSVYVCMHVCMHVCMLDSAHL